MAVIITWYDVLLNVPVTGKDGRTVVWFDLHRNKTWHGGEEMIRFHSVLEDGKKKITYFENNVWTLASSWAFFIENEEARRIGIEMDFQNVEKYRGVESRAIERCGEYKYQLVPVYVEPDTIKEFSISFGE